MFKTIGFLLLTATFCSGQNAYCQTKSRFTLADCVKYAVENNIDMGIAKIDERMSKLNYQYSKYELYPSVSPSVNYGTNFGRSINPTTNQFENTSFSSLGLGFNTNVLLFGWFQKRKNIQSTYLSSELESLRKEKVANEVELTVITAFLRVLLAKEQIKNAELQIGISMDNQNKIQKYFEAGKSNRLDLAQALNQLSLDSADYLQAELNFKQSEFELKAIMNFSVENDLELITPENINDLSVEKLEPLLIYDVAKTNLPEIKITSTQKKIASKNLEISKAQSLPQLSIYGSTGTNYSSSYFEKLPNGETVAMPFGKQFGNNLSQYIGIGLSVPIFNNLQSKKYIEQNKLQVQKQIAYEYEASQKLKQEIFKVCVEYNIAYQKYLSNCSRKKYSEEAFYAASKRFESGLINHSEYIIEKNNLLKATNDQLASKYDLYFKNLQIQYYSNSISSK
ncbi:MAG: TolC family protein [Sphingobacterium sp.]|jgi:outer membrane protein|uniref:TolC family protein n=1 Tax=Sphingobacterium sp. TaxID=341027 RepID=UPI0028453290|nr:TolC family protein [Sphingobacterium sp.]MDR3008601.1 TolC family protein [Sphingobacterium sp.]